MHAQPCSSNREPGCSWPLSGFILAHLSELSPGTHPGVCMGGAQLLLAGEHLDDVTKEEGQRRTFPLVLVKEMLLVRVRYFVFPL